MNDEIEKTECNSLACDIGFSPGASDLQRLCLSQILLQSGTDQDLLSDCDGSHLSSCSLGNGNRFSVGGWLQAFRLSETECSDHPSASVCCFDFSSSFLHTKTFDLLRGFAEKGAWFPFYLMIFVEVCFFGTIILHVAVSITRAFITLGWLQSEKTMRILDKVIWVICALAFIVSAVAIIKTQLAMFAG